MLACDFFHVDCAVTLKRIYVLFVLADDLDLAEMQYMPMTRNLIGGHGATFDKYFVTDSLCCPSRTTTLRGQYPHNTGVRSNGHAAQPSAALDERITDAIGQRAGGYEKLLPMWTFVETLQRRSSEAGAS